MQNETILMLALIAAALQVVIQLFGAIKAFMEWLTAREKTKGFNRSQRSKPKRRKPK
ncbi:hypothetical protein [Paenibacillus crassostreae]|uniref:hypothetical protein n=1 Tax=Paenibacillus crassostreae TaxID=1763538 RepID=UPI000A82F572|nr:hypothetical protein [Paenibacillus crassostreae]